MLAVGLFWLLAQLVAPPEREPEELTMSMAMTMVEAPEVAPEQEAPTPQPVEAAPQQAPPPFTPSVQTLATTNQAMDALFRQFALTTSSSSPELSETFYLQLERERVAERERGERSERAAERAERADRAAAERAERADRADRAAATAEREQARLTLLLVCGGVAAAACALALRGR